jgi:hypothetical protein
MSTCSFLLVSWLQSKVSELKGKGDKNLGAWDKVRSLLCDLVVCCVTTFASSRCGGAVFAALLLTFLACLLTLILC